VILKMVIATVTVPYRNVLQEHGYVYVRSVFSYYTVDTVVGLSTMTRLYGGWLGNHSSIPSRGERLFCSPEHPDCLWHLTIFVFNG
jgi:hypothetical protein